VGAGAFVSGGAAFVLFLPATDRFPQQRNPRMSRGMQDASQSSPPLQSSPSPITAALTFRPNPNPLPLLLVLPLLAVRCGDRRRISRLLPVLLLMTPSCDRAAGGRWSIAPRSSSSCFGADGCVCVGQR
jgi:hypothetical protein